MLRTPGRLGTVAATNSLVEHADALQYELHEGPHRASRGGLDARWADFERVTYVWTERESAIDAYDEALRVLQVWPTGARPVDVAAQGRYLPVAGVL